MSAGIDIVVAVADGGEPLAECAGALRREAGDEWRVVHGPRAWEARRRALAESDADVVAFVDPDVVVGDGWLDALRAGWESSPHSIGAVGGPIRGEAPEWAAGRLGLIDLGGQMLELDPAERTLFGGNLSFWRRALVGVGGFGAPVDGRDGRDWLSEEHEAQRQLGHWGWLVRYDPALAAARVIPDGGSVRRAWRYGVRTGVAGSRERGTALRQGVRSGAGAVSALARGRRADASERIARAAENLGVVAGTRRSPASTTPIAARSTLSANKTVDVDLVVLYHRFAAGEPDPLGLCVAPGHFAEQLNVLSDEFEVVPLSDIAGSVRRGEPGAGRIAITIDDGYTDNLTTGIPMIADAGLPATLFAATGHIEEQRHFFWDEMAQLITGPGKRPHSLTINGHTWRTTTAAERETARAELHRQTQPGSHAEIEATLEELRNWAQAATDDLPRPVTTEELKQIASTPGIEIGAHTRDHVNLAHQQPGEARLQVERSRDDVIAWTGTMPRAFSYPFGIPRHDVDHEAIAVVADSGFECAVVNQPVPVEAGASVFAIPRAFAPDIGGDEFRRWLQASLS